jgi:hypothetical protein
MSTQSIRDRQHGYVIWCVNQALKYADKTYGGEKIPYQKYLKCHLMHSP